MITPLWTTHRDFGDLLTLGAVWLLLAGGVWATLVLLALLLEAGSRGRVRATWVCPAGVRRVLLPTLGVALAGGVPAHAVTAVQHRPDGASSTQAGLLAPLPMPDRALGRMREAPPQRDEAARLVVRAGDTLWGLATAQLPGGGTAADVARLVHRLHEENRSLIGPDPDLILPGQHLVLPRHLDPAPTRTEKETHRP